LVQSLERNRLDKGHQIRQAVGESAENESSERRLAAAGVKPIDVEQRKPDRSDGRTLCGKRSLPEQAGGREHAQLTPRDPVQLKRPPLRRSKRDPDFTFQHERETTAWFSSAEQRGPCVHLHKSEVLRAHEVAHQGVESVQRRVRVDQQWSHGHRARLSRTRLIVIEDVALDVSCCMKLSMRAIE
jgi:hypothetical protein